jgi:hypothetical protein
MKLENILLLPFADQIAKLCVDTISERDPKAYREEYNGKRERRDTSVGNRKDKTIAVYSETEKDKEGNPIKTGSDTITVSKIHSNIPKRIVRTASAFLFGGEMKVELSDSNDATEYFKEQWTDKLKMKSVLAEFARTVMIESKSAMLFYPRMSKDDAGKEIKSIGVLVLNCSNSDFYPHFDEYGNMDAFTRKYVVQGDDGKEQNCVWIQTAENTYIGTENSGTWSVVTEKNVSGKITVVYSEQESPEWEDVAVNMDAFEMRLSRLVDTNDYFSEPILKSYGQSSLPTKDTVGKTLEFDVYVDPETGKETHGDADYLVWQQSIESTKLELDEHKREIHTGTSTPDISFESLKGMTQISGTALKFMFLDAHIKAIEKMEIFGPAVIRCISVVKSMISNLTETKHKNALSTANIKVTFGSILPDDIKEIVDVLVAANGNKPLNSQETITSHSPFTKDAAEEIKKINSEADAESSRNSLIGTVVETSPAQ